MALPLTLHYSTAYPEDDPKVEDVRSGFEPTQFDEHGNREPGQQHKMDEDFAIGDEEEEEQEEQADEETHEQWQKRQYGKDVPYREQDEGGPGELEEEEEGRRKRDQGVYSEREDDREEERKEHDDTNEDGDGQRRNMSYGDAEENVWATPGR